MPATKSVKVTRKASEMEKPSAAKVTKKQKVVVPTVVEPVDESDDDEDDEDEGNSTSLHWNCLFRFIPCDNRFDIK
jgi:hypothetical protein